MDHGYTGWYDRLTHRAQQVADGYAGWVGRVEFEWFVTLTIPWLASENRADQLFKELMQSLGKDLGTPVAYIVGKEGRSKSGASVPWHFHAALIAAKSIPQERIQATWRRIIAREHDQGDTSVLVKAFDPTTKGVAYITKMATDSSGYIDQRWLERFDPSIGADKPKNKRIRRNEERYRSQVAAMSVHHGQTVPPATL